MRFQAVERTEALQEAAHDPSVALLRRISWAARLAPPHGWNRIRRIPNHAPQQGRRVQRLARVHVYSPWNHFVENEDTDANKSFAGRGLTSPFRELLNNNQPDSPSTPPKNWEPPAGGCPALPHLPQLPIVWTVAVFQGCKQFRSYSSRFRAGSSPPKCRLAGWVVHSMPLHGTQVLSCAEPPHADQPAK